MPNPCLMYIAVWIVVAFWPLQQPVVVSAFQSPIWKPALSQVVTTSTTTTLRVATTIHFDGLKQQTIDDIRREASYYSSVMSSTTTSPPPPQNQTTVSSSLSSSAVSSAVSSTPAPTTITKAKPQTNTVRLLTSTQELLDTMEGSCNNNNNNLVVIKYYANYCKICQRAGIQYKKIATEYPNVEFAKVETMALSTTSSSLSSSSSEEENNAAQTLRTLGVTKFPFIQIYRQGKCVASFSTGPSHLFVKRVRDTLDACQKRTNSEWDDFVTEFSNEIESNISARRNLATTTTTITAAAQHQ